MKKIANKHIKECAACDKTNLLGDILTFKRKNVIIYKKVCKSCSNIIEQANKINLED